MIWFQYRCGLIIIDVTEVVKVFLGNGISQRERVSKIQGGRSLGHPHEEPGLLAEGMITTYSVRKCTDDTRGVARWYS